MTTELKSRVPQLRKALADRVATMDQITSIVTVEDNGGIVVSEEKAQAFRKAKREADSIMQEIKRAEGNGPDAEIKAFLEGKDGGSAAVAALQSHAEKLGIGIDGKSLGQAFLESDAFKEFKSSGFHGNMQGAYELEGVDLGQMAGFGQKDVYTGLITGTTNPRGFGTVQRDALVPRQFRTARVRDLFPVTQTSANLIEFFRVTGFTNNAAPVAERNAGAFALKPQSTLAFAPDQAPVRTIAHYEVAHRNVLDDEPQLRSVVDNELLYGLRLTEDAQILSGDGTGENLRGILATPGIQSYTAPLNTTRTDAIRQAITRSVLAYYDPTGLVIHPFDWEAVELQKDNQGAYIVTAAVAVGAAKQIWRLPVVDTPAIAQGTYLVGAFGLGAQLYDRMQANVRIAEQHADFFVRNAVAILAEERLALAVKRPESFVKMDIAAA